jgi:hypothetical protein
MPRHLVTGHAPLARWFRMPVREAAAKWQKSKSLSSLPPCVFMRGDGRDSGRTPRCCAWFRKCGRVCERRIMEVIADHTRHEHETHRSAGHEQRA